MILRAYIGDITHVTRGAIVNAAKVTLLGGGGVDGAVHAAAGPELREHCEVLPVVEDFGGKDDVRCPTGHAVLTPSFGMKCDSIIHTVGPIYKDDTVTAPRLLRNCYHNSLYVAMNNGIGEVSFPSIGTGIYGYPLGQAAAIAVRTAVTVCGEAKAVVDTVGNNTPLNPDMIVNFVCWDEEMLAIYRQYILLAYDNWSVMREF